MAAPALDFSLFGGAESLPPAALNAGCSSSSGSSSGSSSESQPSDDESAAAPPARGRAAAQWQPQKVPMDPNDWLWVHTEEPHRTRRKAILAAHPEVSRAVPPVCPW
jgi:sphingolipid delta-4 desaturase